MKNIGVGEDGTIFRIKEDGSIHKIAKIGTNYNITSISTSSKNNSLSWFLFAIAIIVCIILGINLSNSSSRINSLEYRLEQSKKDLSKEISITNVLRKDIESLKESLNTIGNKYPIIVNSMDVERNDFDSKVWNTGTYFNTSSTNFVRTKIHFYGIKTDNIELKIKLIMPSGNLYKLNSSPSDCTEKESIYITSGKSSYYTSGGYGYKTSLGWTTGTWRYEIWYRNSLLSTKSFTIY